MQDDAITGLPRILADLGEVDRAFILYDHAVADTAAMVQKLCNACPMAAVPAGEASKCFAQAERLAAELFLQGLTERSVLIIVGGGMAMDLGTFVAGVYAGGLRYIHVPTNLMAMADAAFGGRGYLDVGNVKNLVSVRHHPSAVVIDLTILHQLPDRLLRAGLVEIIKIAVMMDAEFFGWVCEHMDAILDRESAVLATCINNAVRLKGEIGLNETDESRLFTTFGHTVGQALEALTQFKLSHAEAVSMGMACEMNMVQLPETERVIACLRRLNMPLTIPVEFHSQSLWDIMQRDRKVRAGNVRIAVPKTIGTGELRTVTFQDLLRARE